MPSYGGVTAGSGTAAALSVLMAVSHGRACVRACVCIYVFVTLRTCVCFVDLSQKRQSPGQPVPHPILQRQSQVDVLPCGQLVPSLSLPPATVWTLKCVFPLVTILVLLEFLFFT